MYTINLSIKAELSTPQKISISFTSHWVYCCLVRSLVALRWEPRKIVEVNLHDAWTVGQISIRDDVISHLSVLRLRVVLSGTGIGLHLLFKRKWVGEDSQALLELPAASFTDGFGAANGFSQHESTYNSEELYESNR